MRKITENAVSAFYAGAAACLGNTSIVVDDSVTMCLHGNAIAKLFNGNLYITTAGWDTRTTKERLNGLHGVRVNHVAGKLYLNGNRWDGSWIKVS